VAPQTYVKSENGGALRQGEILTNFTQYQLDVDRLRAQQPIEVLQITHPCVVVLSQDCDLDQDYTRRLNNKIDNLLASILFCSVAPNDEDFRRGIGLGSKEWKKVEENRESRLHYLRAVPQADDASNEGLPDLIVDFRQYFAVPTAEAYFSLEAAHRRCRLETPYVEHLSQRFAVYTSRIALPLDHHLPLPVEPVVADVIDVVAAEGVDIGAVPAEASAGGNGGPAVDQAVNPLAPPNNATGQQPPL
jgi:hypothetical protein